jgi:hypothetical protein
LFTYFFALLPFSYLYRPLFSFLSFSELIPKIEDEITNSDIPSDPVNSRKAIRAILDKYQSLSGGKPEEPSKIEKNKDSIK